MLFVLENIVKRLTWLILLAFPALVCAQEGSEPPGDTEVVPAVTAGEDDEKSGDAPQEPGRRTSMRTTRRTGLAFWRVAVSGV